MKKKKSSGEIPGLETKNKTRKSRRKRKVGLLAALIIVAILAAAFDVRLRIKRYEVVTYEVTETIRAVLITDLHSCRYGEKEEGLIQAVNGLHPDVVFLAGDICDDVLPDDHVEELLQGIAGRYPCFYVTGNHEYWSNRLDDILELFRSYGVTVLNGSYDTLEIKGQAVTVCGVTDPDAMLYTDNGADTKTQLDAMPEEADRGDFTILLAHRPEEIELYAQYDFDLVLSGHAHGGQWRLPGFVNGLFAPNQGLFPKYAGGIYKVEDTVMIVSRGLARESTKVPRIFNRPELVLVTVTPSGDV